MVTRSRGAVGIGDGRARALRAAAAAALLLVAWPGAAGAQERKSWPETPQIYFSPDGGSSEATVEVIAAARERLDVAMYSISTRGPIWRALEEAIGRGVVIRMVLHAAKGENADKAEALDALGVHVYTTTNTMHEKFAIVDGALLINGSANWSMGAQTRYSENTVVYGKHPHLVRAFQEEFARLLEASTPVSKGAAAHRDDAVKLAEVPARARPAERALFTSTNRADSTVVADEIVALLRSAKESILIDVAHFNSRKIAEALVAVHRERPDLRVEVLLDLGEYSDPKSRSRDLERAGIPVRYKVYSMAWHYPRSRLQHHKNVVVDGERMITGSYNWSDTAEQSNYENVVIVDGSVARNRAFVRAVIAEHDRLWDMGRNHYRAFRQAVLAGRDDPGFQPLIPVHFDTPYFDRVMTLTRNEFRPLRGAAFRAGLLERTPEGKIVIHVDASYVDRTTGKVWDGPAPTGSFIPVPEEELAGPPERR